MSDAIDGVCVHGCSRFYLINKSQEICLHVFRTVEKIIREPGLVRSAGSAVAYFYVLFYAFFEFVVLAVYVVACNSWHIAPFLSYFICYMCTRQSAVSGSPPNVVIYNMPDFLSKKTQMPLHITAAFKQRKEFFGGESVLCIGKISLPHFLYKVYQIFRCTQIFVGFFDGNKKAPCGAFSNTETFFFCALSYVLQGICLGVNHFSSIHLWY